MLHSIIIQRIIINPITWEAYKLNLVRQRLSVNPLAKHSTNVINGLGLSLVISNDTRYWSMYMID